jgi:hypothetical protein
VALVVDGERLPATWDESRVLPDRASAVLYLKFPLSAKAALALRARKAPAEIAIDHPAYEAHAPLGPETMLALAGDLEEDVAGKG